MSTQPYRDFSWHDLGRIAQDLAERLGRVVPERHRADLDTRIEALLWEMAQRIRPNPYMPGRPEQLFHRHGMNYIADGYWRQAEIDLRNMRIHALSDAASYVLGADADAWLSIRKELPGLGKSTPRNAAYDSEAGLRAALDDLQAVAIARGGTVEPREGDP